MAVRCVVDCSCESIVARGKGETDALAAYAAGLAGFRTVSVHADAGHDMTLRFYPVDEPSNTEDCGCDRDGPCWEHRALAICRRPASGPDQTRHILRGTRVCAICGGGDGCNPVDTIPVEDYEALFARHMTARDVLRANLEGGP